jgi:hypothetical protein
MYTNIDTTTGLAAIRDYVYINKREATYKLPLPQGAIPS